MADKKLMSAAEVAEQLGVSKAYAYKVIRKLNEELEADGKLIIAGRVCRAYFEQRFSIPSDEEE